MAQALIGRPGLPTALWRHDVRRPGLHRYGCRVHRSGRIPRRVEGPQRTTSGIRHDPGNYRTTRGICQSRRRSHSFEWRPATERSGCRRGRSLGLPPGQPHREDHRGRAHRGPRDPRRSGPERCPTRSPPAGRAPLDLDPGRGRSVEPVAHPAPRTRRGPPLRAAGFRAVGGHACPRDLGALPVAYGTGLVERVRVIAPRGVDAALDVGGVSAGKGGPCGRGCRIGARARARGRARAWARQGRPPDRPGRAPNPGLICVMHVMCPLHENRPNAVVGYGKRPRTGLIRVKVRACGSRRQSVQVLTLAHGFRKGSIRVNMR